MADIPTKLFDVRNGNGGRDADTTLYPAASFIVFRDQPAKNRIIDSFATAYNYPTVVSDPANPGQTIPNPQSKQAFYTARLTDFIKEIHRSVVIRAAEVTAAATASSSANGELP